MWKSTNGRLVLDKEKSFLNLFVFQDMPFKCPYCPDFAFLNKGPLTQHVAQRHPEEAGVSPQVCSDCGKICKSKHQLAQHKRRHHVKNDCVWQCKACSQVFSDTRAISKHVVLHSEIEFFQVLKIAVLPLLCIY